MKRATLLHNPTAGDNDFSKKELLKIIESEDFECSYSSVKDEGWENFREKSEFLIIAGGDGTVRRVAKALLNRQLLQKQYPLALLPHGTANNVACSLGIEGSVREIVQRWHHPDVRPFDIGKVRGAGENMFFLEGFGVGIFPRLMKVLSKEEDQMGETAEEKLEAARTKLIELVEEYEGRQCTVIADGHEHTDLFLMVEVMNIRSIGPNLVMAADADPGDGWLDLVLVPVSSRAKLVSFLRGRAEGHDHDFGFQIIKAKKIKIKADGKDIHADDERLKFEKSAEIRIDVMPGMLKFIMPEA